MSKGFKDGVAIVGFGAVFPGSPTARSFWRLVAEGLDATTEVPPGRWPLDPARAFDPRVGQPDHVYTTRGGFIADEPPDLDGLNVDPALVARLDPVFRLALRAAGEAWRSARTEALDRSRVGIVFGNIVLPTETTSSLTRQTIGREIEAALGAAPSESDEEEPRNAFPAGLPAELVAKALGLGGVAFTLDAACASSLYSLKLARDELLSGRADAMIAGGLSRPDALYTQMGFSQLRALSPRGRAAPFDAEGDGLIVGEGAGLFVLKRLEDAERAGDEIHGVIRGIGLSNDIQGDVLAPSGEGQLRAMRAAYAQAGWSPADVDLIECHATGTPVGDSVEFESLKTLWSDAGAPAEPRRCALGSVKSNVGHALTAAGAAGLLKVLLALRHKAIPPIANHASPSPRLGLDESPFRILKKIEPWPTPAGRPRRAAISGFGFGGINAHVLIEEWDERAMAAREPKAIAPPAREPVAIVGAAARFGRRDAEALQQRALGREAIPANGDASLALDELRVRMGRFRIPPRELEEMLLQQSLMLQVAADALADSKWSAEAGLRTSVLVGLGLDLNTTNYHLRWWLAARAPVWNEELGWGMSPEELDAWVAEARDAIHPALSANRTMGSLGGLVASRIAREFRIGGPSFSVSSDENSGVDALRVAADWLARGEIDSAVVAAVDLAGDPRLVQAARQLLADDFEPGEGAVALILKRRADAIRDGDRIHALIGGSSERAVVIESPRRRIGWAGAAEGLAAVASAALGLEHAIIPPEGKLNEASPGESPSVPRYWLRNRADGPRRALVRARALGGAERFVALESESAAEISSARPLEPFPLAIFAVRGAQAAQLGERVESLARLLADNADQPIDALARRWWRESRADSRGRLGLALTADNAASLALALKAVGDDLRSGRPVGRSTVPGVEVFAPVAAWGAPPGVALAYPGLGNVFPGMGGELSALWPELMDEWEGRFETLRDQFAPEVWWNGPLPTRFDDHRPAILGQISVGALTTALFLKLGVRPMAAVGYSMGESAALVALGAWPNRDEMTRRLLESPLFAAELAGPCHAARRVWGLADEEPVDWVAGIVPRSREEIEAAIGDESRVHVLIRNAADETVIGGRGDAVRRVVETLRCPFLPLPLVSTVHCPIGAEVEPAYRTLHDQETSPVPGVSFYSGVWGRAYSPDRRTAAEAITAQAAGMIDFPRVVEAAHADGARVFLEMGPGSSCTRLIGRILGDRPHLAISANPGEGPALDAVLRALGALIAASVPVDLEFLYGRGADIRETAGDQKPQREIVIRRERVPNRSLDALRPVRKAVPVPTPPPALAPVASTPFSTAVLETAPSMSDPIHAPAPPLSSAAGPRDSLPPLTRQFLETQRATADAHETFLRLAQSYSETMSRQVALELNLIGGGAAPVAAPPVEPALDVHNHEPADEPPAPAPRRVHPKTGEPIFLDRDQCLELAVGSIGAVLGPEYAEIDAHPTRVRLPDEPLMLVDRVVSIEGTLHSLTSGRVVTEHDVKPDAWYLDGGRIASCVAIESGQADLFLAGYLGIDFITKGLAVYRLLDATVTFHRSLPEPGETVRYDIKILNFFRQDETHLFRFEFTATIDGEPLLTMRDGCAGFFTAEELASGKGVVPRPLDARPRPGVRPDDWRDLAPPASTTLDRHQVEAIRAGNLFEAFGAPFDRLDVARPIGLPGGRMALVDRVVALESNGGRYGLGLIRAEADIHPDDWFLTCHFVDDRVMPGTLMYECCLHTMRILLMRMGWVGSADSTRFDPVPGVANRLRCRGQVIETTKVAAYEVTIKEIGYGPEPYAIADALMYADGKPIVEITDMALKLTGSSREELERLWDEARPATVRASAPASTLVYEKDRILAFATGAPSACFGYRYRPFDEGRFIARLPRPPYQFIDRATILEGEPWTQAVGTSAEVEYNIPPDAWYFEADRQPRVPYAVLLEAALQSCGFVSAFMGSALLSDEPLKFRNLGGRARQFRIVDRNSGTLRTTVRVTKVNRSAGMIIQNYEMEVRDRDGLVFEGDTYFGFFHPDALANQVGIREAAPYELAADERRAARSFPLPDRPPLPDRRWRMVEHVDALLTSGGPRGLGLIEGSGAVDPGAWFFEAHFLDDPVWPGSLGLESLLQLLKVFAEDRWGLDAGAVFDSPALGVEHQWTYRGQIVSTNNRVTTRAVITSIDDAARRVAADGWLLVDGKVIYQMNGFSLGVGASD